MAKKHAQAHDTAAVDEFMRGVDHPLKAALELVRSSILGASPTIAEGIKWNSPSFRVEGAADYFATINLHPRNRPADCVLVVFHEGAKGQGVKGPDRKSPPPKIGDPAGLLEWLGEERCTARFRDLKEVKVRKAALQDIVRQWIARL